MRKIMLAGIGLLLLSLPVIAKDTTKSGDSGWQIDRARIQDPSKKKYSSGQEWVKCQDWAFYYLQIGQLRLAEEQCMRGIECGKKIEPAQQASLYGLLGVIYQQQGRFPVAIQELKKAADLTNKDPKSDTVMKALRQMGLAEALLADGQKQAAIDVLLTAKSKLKDTDAGYGSLLQTLGKAYADDGRFADSEKTLNESVAINLREGSFYDPGMAAESLFSLCVVYEKQNELTKALEVIERAIPLAEKAFGPADRRMQKIIHEKVVLNENTEWSKLLDAGMNARKDGKIMESIEKLNQALKIIEVKDPDSNLMALTVATLGQSYGSAGEYRKAEEMLTRAVPLYKRYYPDVLPGVEKMLNEVKQRQQ